MKKLLLLLPIIFILAGCTGEVKKTEQEIEKEKQAQVEMYQFIEEEQKKGYIIKTEITGIENELLYIYVSAYSWMSLTRENKVIFLQAFGRRWVAAGNKSVYFLDVMTNEKLGRWSYGTPQIYK